jgi:putative lipoic acid-binding regulatory protein
MVWVEMNKNVSLIEFPCEFTIKIIGNNANSFEQDIRAIIFKHFANGKEIKISCKTSDKNNYIAISATVHAKSKEQLDAVYMELTKHPDAKMVL